jgi:uncharacterized protein YuzE
MISTTYDDEEDALYVRIAARSVKVAETREVEPGVMLDMDANGRVIGIEVLGVKARSSETARAA